MLARFGKLAILGDHERQRVSALGARTPQAWRQGMALPREVSDAPAARIIVSGWACCARVLGNGRRQITNVFVPGDVIGLPDPARVPPAFSVIALTPLRTVQAQEILTEWTDSSREPVFSKVLDLIAAEDALFMLNQVVRLGRQTAYERIASWLIELDHRFSARGLTSDGSLVFPLTQEAIADVMGLSVVHVNRTLQEMRREDRIELRGGRLRIIDRNALMEAGEFIAPAPGQTPHWPAPHDRSQRAVPEHSAERRQH